MYGKNLYVSSSAYRLFLIWWYLWSRKFAAYREAIKIVMVSLSTLYQRLSFVNISKDYKQQEP